MSTIIVAGGVIEQEGEYLLIQEAREDVRGEWNIPAGKQDPGETISEAAKREICEECGLSVELTGVCQIRSWRSAINTVITIIFSTKIVGGEINFNPDEILDAKWFTYDEILAMKPELRSADFLIGAINNLRNHKVAPIDVVMEGEV
ncbi:NUDIX domain-containing protein [Candidatus Saccharibacteria bacterium]|nr:NUDIX domain-containing protein [Candidatus Saccharibacteria bacterium]